MENKKIYTLPNLPYEYNALEPYILEEQLKLHHQKHHQAYVNGANSVFEKLEKARKEEKDIDIKSLQKELSFYMAGYFLHSLFWINMAPGKDDNKPEGEIGALIEEEFGSFERFKKEFAQAAVSTEGSGWAILAFDSESNRSVIMQIEKHNVNICPTLKILVVLDVWEHAYYLDYKNDRAKFVEAFFNLIDWKEVEKRL
jgi:Fe-Mn family superoxide dismutase